MCLGLMLKRLLYGKLLNQIVKKYLPADIVRLRQKGFGSPIKSCLLGKLKNFSRSLLQNPLLPRNNLFNQQYIYTLLESHAAHRVDSGNKIWSIANLKILYRINVSDRDPELAKENVKDLFCP